MIGFISISVTINRALSLIYTFSSPPLHTHQDSQFPLLVSCQRISTQKLALQITMKSFSYFVFEYSLLLCPNLY
jgi:hypothetical protein